MAAMHMATMPMIAMQAAAPACLAPSVRVHRCHAGGTLLHFCSPQRSLVQDTLREFVFDVREAAAFVPCTRHAQVPPPDKFSPRCRKTIHP
jgi:hypothetical protein